jgi:electron transfer flavoprotein beta subunit
MLWSLFQPEEPAKLVNLSWLDRPLTCLSDLKGFIRGEMQIIVCLKPVPDPKHWKNLTIDPILKVLVREGMPNVINPLDRNALEEALIIKEKEGGEVILLSMAPLFCLSVLREGLAIGGDRAVLLSDHAFAGSDTLATSYILSEAIKRLAPFDLILCGNDTIDGGTGQVGPQISQILGIEGINSICKVEKILEEKGKNRSFIVRRKMEHGYLRMEVKLPVLLSMVRESNHPRYATFMGILEAEKKEIQVWSGNNLDIDSSRIGLTGSPTKMSNLFMPELKRRREIVKGTPEVVSSLILDKIHQAGLL